MFGFVVNWNIKHTWFFAIIVPLLFLTMELYNTLVGKTFYVDKPFFIITLIFWSLLIIDLFQYYLFTHKSIYAEPDRETTSDDVEIDDARYYELRMQESEDHWDHRKT